MPSPLHVAWATIAFAFIFSANISTANAQQKSLTADQRQIIDTVSTIFSAASTEDIAKLDSVQHQTSTSSRMACDSTATRSWLPSKPYTPPASAPTST
jgi:hypothetical protein